MRVRLLALFAAALVARLVAAASSGLYVDEAFGFFMSRHGLGEIVIAARPDNNPPLWYFLVHPLALATHSGLVLRLPSCVLGALAAPLTYLVGRRLGESVGLLGGSLVAVAYTSWLVDAQTRAYGMVTVLAMAVLWMVLEARDDGRPPGGWTWMAAAAMALPLLHFVGWLVDAALLLACLLPETPRRGPRMACLAAGLAAGGAWMVYAATNPHSALHARTLASSGAAEMPLLPSFLAGILMPMHWAAFRPVPNAEAATWALSALTCGAALYGAFRAVRQDRRTGWTLVLCLLIPWLGIVAGALAGFQPYQNRYLVPVSGAFYLLLAAPAARPGAVRAGLALLLGINAITLALFPFDRFLHNQDWRSAASWIERREQKGDVVAAYTPYSLVGLDFYYHAGRAEVDLTTPNTMSFRFAPDYDGAEQLTLVPSMLDGDLEARLRGRRVFLIFNQGDMAAREAIFAWFSRHWTATDVYRAETLTGWGNIVVIELSPRQAGGAR